MSRTVEKHPNAAEDDHHDHKGIDPEVLRREEIPRVVKDAPRDIESHPYGKEESVGVEDHGLTGGEVDHGSIKAVGRI